jgi:hypothetical protein
MFEGNLYEAGSLQLGKVTHDSAELKISNHDFSLTNGALDGTYLRAAVKVWWAYSGVYVGEYVDAGYVDEGYAKGAGDSFLTDPILRFSGLIYATPTIKEWLSITARRTPPKMYPNVKLRPPLANHLPSGGYVLPFDGAILKIEAAK